MSGKDDTSFGEDSYVPPASNNEEVLVGPHEEGVRKRLMTTKGYHYVMDVKKGNLKAKRSELVKLMRATLLERGQSVELSKFKKGLSEAQVSYAEFKDIVGGIKEFVNPDENLDEIEGVIRETEREWSSFEADIKAEIKHLEIVEQQKMESRSVAWSFKSSSRVSSKDKDSLKSKRSSTSSVKTEKFRLRKEEAALKAKLAFAEEERKLKVQQQRVELMKLEQEQKLEELRLKSELAQNQAMLNVCLTEEREEMVDLEQNLDLVAPVDKDKDMENFLKSIPAVSDIAQTPVLQDPIYTVSQVGGAQTTPSPQRCSALSPQAATFTPASSILEKCMDKLVETSTKLVAATVEQNQVNRQLAISGQLPKISIPVFNGDPLQYPAWNSSFNALIDSKPMDAQAKLNFLNQYLSGKPKQVVEQYLLIGTDEAYQSARKLLKERYGNCNVVGSAFLNKLENWPKVGIKDAETLRDLSDFLEKIKAASETTPSLKVLDFARENVKILSKLPVQLQSKWRGIVKKCRAKKGDGAYPPFTEFAAFVKDCAEKANIPELEDLTKTRDTVKPVDNTKRPTKGKEVNSFATQGTDQNKIPNIQNQGKKELCLFYKEHHHLDKCKKFAEIPLRERKDFFFDKFLCFGCASSRQHQAASCKNKLVCRVCSAIHPTCLHQPKGNAEVISNCTNVCTIPEQEKGLDHAMIVPVWVRHISKPSQEVLQYAVLDDQSNVSFVSQSLCEQLNLQGSPTDLLLTTVQERNVHIPSSRICGLEVLDFNRDHTVKLPMLFTRDSIPASRSQIPKASVAQEWEHLRPIADKLMPYEPDVEISLLIGNNCPSIVRPREVVVGKDDDPYGQRSLMGWGIVGKVCKSTNESDKSEAVCNKIVVSEAHEHFAFSTKVKEIINPQRIIKVLESDFVEGSTRRKSYSVEDKRFLSILENSVVKRADGHYEMPLPLKMDRLCLPYNRQLAVKRWHQLLARFKKNPKFLEDYRVFMKDVIDLCAEKVPPDRLKVQDGRINYVPHTGVYHPRKRDQIRVVFDCSAQFDGVCLNDYLLQGPDQLNTLLGILCRFRQERVALMTDIKKMFHQFMVSEEHRDLLRFLWWEDGDPKKEVIEFRMKVHLFGAGSSPGCANFGLKKAADDGEAEYGKEAAEFIRRDFYVDDGLKSVPTVEEAVTLIKASQGICARAGLKLQKIMSNKREVLEAFPIEERAQSVKESDLKVDPLPLERALGVIWCVENDSFQFRIEMHDRPFTRRGILSTVSSIYDPSGYVAPVTLKGKQILQQMCRDKLDWDSPVPENLRSEWEKWRHDVVSLEQLEIQRCFKPENFGEIQVCELHYFSDASLEGYGQCSFLRLVNEKDQPYCSFVIGKARVAPLKQLTVPRLELAAATVSAKMSEFLHQELSYTDVKEYFWTDSKIVLGYVNNEARRFHVYVANRVQQIRDLTNPSSWMYVDTESNPADHASRGLTASQLLQGSTWLFGPEFLWKEGVFKPLKEEEIKVKEDDPEVKKGNVLMSRVASAVALHPDPFKSDRLAHISSWWRLLKVVALCLQLKSKLRNRKVKLSEQESAKCVTPLPKASVTLTEFQLAERRTSHGSQDALREKLIDYRKLEGARRL